MSTSALARKRRHRARALHDEIAFARYSAKHRANEPDPNAEAIAQTIARKHCAGHQKRVIGSEVIKALQRGPNEHSPTSNAVRWMIGSIRIPDCTRLVLQCGIRYEDLARYVRVRPQQRTDLVRYLNQFTITEQQESNTENGIVNPDTQPKTGPRSNTPTQAVRSLDTESHPHIRR